MNRRQGAPGATLSVRATLAVLLLAAALIGYISVYRVHADYFSHGGGGGGTSRGDASSDGAWLPEAELASSVRGGGNGRGSSPARKKSIPETVTKKQNRVYCMVPFIWTPSAFPTYHAIHASWGKRCDTLRFFIDPVIGDEKVGFYNMTDRSEARAALKAGLIPPDDAVILHDMRRPWHTCDTEENREKNKPVGTCRNIFEKVWRMVSFVARGAGADSANEAEWFVKVDADTFLFPENVGRYVEQQGWSPNNPHYFGHVLNHRRDDRGVSIVAGGAVFFSRAALRAAAASFRRMPMGRGDEEEDGTCRDAYTGTEEVVTAVCLKEHFNILAEPAVDPEGREMVSLYEADDIIAYNRTHQGEWWFWEGKQRFPCHDDGDCLAHRPLAFHHYKRPEDLLDLEKEFYGSVMKGEADDRLIRKNGKVAARRWPNFDATQQYFERVRAAMKAIEFEESGNLATPNAQAMQQTQKLKNRLYCMVPFIWTPPLLHSYRAIHKTWGKRCDVLKFMIDPIIGDKENGFVDLRNIPDEEMPEDPDEEMPEDVVVIDIKRPWNTCLSSSDGNCRNIWEKIWRSWIAVDSRGDSDLAEWFVKIDADSFLFPENLKRYVRRKGWSPDEHHYFGNILMHKGDSVPMIAGAAVFFSRATLKAAANIFRAFETKDKSYNGRFSKLSRTRCEDQYTEQEEVVTSVCLKGHLGVDADPALDEMGQELVTVGEIEDVLLWNRTEQGEWWYWKNKPKKHPKTGKDNMHHCCGDLPIAFHGYKDSQWFFKLENEFYAEEVSDAGDSWKKYRWRNPNATERYFDRVRNAMKEAANVGI